MLIVQGLSSNSAGQGMGTCQSPQTYPMECICMARLAGLLAGVEACGQPINVAVWVVRVLIMPHPTVKWVQGSLDVIITPWSDCRGAAKPASHLQAQLLTLSSLCWCEPLPSPDTSTNSQLMLEIIHSRPVTQPHPQPSQTAHQQSWGCRWDREGFPKGPALLSYLFSKLQEADSRAAPLVRFLFLAAFQPYMQHMRCWMYSTASVAPHFGTAEGDSVGVGPQVLNKDVSGRLYQLLLVPFALCRLSVSDASCCYALLHLLLCLFFAMPF